MHSSQSSKRFSKQPPKPIKLAIRLNSSAVYTINKSSYTPVDSTKQSHSPVCSPFQNQFIQSSLSNSISRKFSSPVISSFLPMNKELRTNSYASTKASEVNTPAGVGIKSKLSKGSSHIFDQRFSRQKTDGSLSSILSLVKEPSRAQSRDIDKNQVKQISHPELKTNQDGKNKEFRDMMNQVFRQQNSLPIGDSKQYVTVQNSQSITIKDADLIGSVYFSPKSVITPNEPRIRPQTTNSLVSPLRSSKTVQIKTKIREPSINTFSNILLTDESIGPNDRKAVTAASQYTNSLSPQKSLNSSFKFNDQIKKFGSVSPTRPTTGVSPNISKLSRPGTAQKSNITLLVRPLTMTKYSKVNTGLNRDKGYKLSENQRSRLENYIDSDFHEDLIYTESYLNLEQYVDKDFLNLKDVKDYIEGKQEVGFKLQDMIMEYKREKQRRIDEDQAAASIVGNISYKNLENLTTEENVAPNSRLLTSAFIKEHEDFNIDSYNNDDDDDDIFSRKTPRNDVKGPAIIRRERLRKPTSVKGKALAKIKSLKSVNFFDSRTKIEDGAYTMTSSRDVLGQVGAKGEKINKIRKGLLQYVSLLTSTGLSLKQVMEQGLKPLQPYQRKGSEAFIKAAKSGSADIIRSYLNKDSSYVFECDASQQTALHWAAKRGHANVCELLIEHEANLERIDITSKTALYFALREGHSEVVRILLFAKANPWSTKMTNYRYICGDQKCIRYLMKARQLDIITTIQNLGSGLDTWQRKAANFLSPSGFNTLRTMCFEEIVENPQEEEIKPE